MSEIVALFSLLESTVASIAGFGAGSDSSVASFCLVVSLALFGAVCINHVAERRDNIHLALNVVVMFIGGVIGNAMLRGVHLPLGNELVVTATLALFGMSLTALVLLLAYRRSDF